MIDYLKQGRTEAARAEDDAKVRTVVETALKEIEAGGDAAVRKMSENFDKYSPPSFRLSQQEIDDLIAKLSPRELEDIQFAQEQVRNFAQAQRDSMQGVHASAQAIIHFGKVARKHGLTGVCLDSLSSIHTIPSVPIVDCFQKIRQQVKCYLQMSGVMGKNELQEVG